MEGSRPAGNENLILDEEERDILESYERGEWRRVVDFEAQIIRLREAARVTLARLAEAESIPDGHRLNPGDEAPR